MARKTADIVFFDKPLRKLVPVAVPLPTANGSRLHALTVRCNDYAWDNVFSHWIMEDTVTTPSRWLIFQCMGRSSRVLLKEQPSREAAEMWLVSLA